MVREAGRDWALVGALWTTGLAYSAAVIFYQLATFLQHPMSSLIWLGSLSALLMFAIFLFNQAAVAQESIQQSQLKKA
jgi:ferrous iron transport protein B